MNQAELRTATRSMPPARHRGRSVSPGALPEPIQPAAGGAAGIRKPVAIEIFRKMASESPVPAGKLRAQLIPDSTWKRAGQVLGPSASQTVARLAHVICVAERIWQNEAAALQFLLRPHAELNQATPYSLLNTESGGRAVENLLAALEFGFPV